MAVFGWVSSTIGLVAIKAIETITNESIKDWLNEKKTQTAKKLLLSLYEQIIVLEHSSRKFTDFLEEFSKSNRFNKPGDDSKISNDVRWQLGWGRLLTKQANEVANQTELVLATLQELNPQAEIYIPEVVEFMKKYEIYTQGEIYLSEQLVVDELLNTTVGELCAIASKIREAVEELTATKSVLAEFIRGEIPFKESL